MESLVQFDYSELSLKGHSFSSSKGLISLYWRVWHSSSTANSKGGNINSLYWRNYSKLNLRGATSSLPNSLFRGQFKCAKLTVMESLVQFGYLNSV